MKAVFFFSLVRIQVKFDTMKDHWLFLGVLYTAGVAFLSYVFIMATPWACLTGGAGRSGFAKFLRPVDALLLADVEV